jgi:FtsP/CotA-like multicopper oxidase with cupredoxin domain
VPAWQVGPTLTASPGGTLTVNLRNCLSEPVSVFIPGQLKATSPVTFTDGQSRQRVRSFDAETAAGGAGSYTWTGVKEGTYLYHSGTHPQVQVQMGLYGALTVGNYGIGDEATLVYSEIDPDLHAAVDDGTYGTTGPTSTFDYLPSYFLINGAAYPGTADIVIPTSTNVLLRFVNAGLKAHVPTLEGGLYMDLIAEDGNPYPFPLSQYGVELPAAKTIDAVLNVGSGGTYALYDRALNLTNGSATGGGMLTHIVAAAAVGAPTAVDDAYATDEDTPLVVAVPGVLGNDTAGAGPGPLTANLISDVSAGTLALISDGSFTYAPNSDFGGTDAFTYVANDGGPDSNAATVTITVTPTNDGPIAVADAYDAVEGETLSVAAPGVLANDVDVDGDGLTATQTGVAPAGTLVLASDGSFDYTPVGTVGAIETFDYVANDGAVDSLPATVTITVVGAPANLPPFANDDFAQTTRNTDLVNFNVILNDVDPDGSIVGATVVITTGAITQRGGAVVANGDGTVTFTPKRGFRGTDTFKYTVNDDAGATSNEATVRVNVVK